MNLDPIVQAALVSGFISVAGLGLGYLVMRRVNDTQADRNTSAASGEVAEAARNLLQPLNDQIDKLSKQMSRMTDDMMASNKRVAQLTEDVRMRDAELEGLRAGVVVLINQLREAGIEPRYQPPAYKPRQ